MNTPILIANVLTLLALIVHAIWGDKDLRVIEPSGDNHTKLEKWVMARGAFHMVSMDFLLATIGLVLINFTGFFQDENLILTILTVYFLAYSISFLVSIFISRQFPKNYFKLGQWILLLVISGLIYFGIN
ncbi:MAG TPA: hypothetical protein DCQ26_15740 [Marinilabiliales bacterium]|nr:MAG: hypothetical protein A2W84_04975 [Bacteroidetes bacterium GWC2_40_13]OFX75502.1 MAG: hypothetical protein A2W96_08595 [Bacteroidetes bacterium GWD2_40_43]OFX94017.1 MAG: hypothetical protein A2W97_14520 [Bacteroidetes bacterium GWE2_40_63]OFY19804.1 MAG: hypothetical protein A2W88_03390 [Bacteroidetes bacterium GWF2_40_13]OFZ28215.1 MAG: hypothetical protein A2437_04885 [Bacteroidetes bacterium RIFOXYC2_FULL_40_12]HAN00052.1 hypothetical protein [Marinilabiliales bacterium]